MIKKLKNLWIKLTHKYYCEVIDTDTNDIYIIGIDVAKSNEGNNDGYVEYKGNKI